MTDFFREIQPAAVLKHGLIKRYLPLYVRKTGSRSKDGRVAYLDAYAGPGLYEDGSPGSPALAVEAAKALAGTANVRQLDGYFVESDRKSFDALEAFVQGEGMPWRVYHGRATARGW